MGESGDSAESRGHYRNYRNYRKLSRRLEALPELPELPEFRKVRERAWIVPQLGREPHDNLIVRRKPILSYRTLPPAIACASPCPPWAAGSRRSRPRASPTFSARRRCDSPPA